MGNDVLILGGGVGGTIVANLVAREVGDRAHVTIVDTTGVHVYQPGFLYVAVGQEQPSALRRSEAGLLRHGIKLVVDTATLVEPMAQKVVLGSGRTLHYDELVLATGSRTVMDEVPGGLAAHEFYTLEGAMRLHRALEAFQGGTIVIGVAGIPYKCPPAPVEFAFLLDDYLRARHIRDKSLVKLLSPLNRAFTIEATSKLVQPILAERGIELTGFFNVESVDPTAKTVTSLEGGNGRLRPARPGAASPRPEGDSRLWAGGRARLGAGGQEHPAPHRVRPDLGDRGHDQHPDLQERLGRPLRGVGGRGRDRGGSQG